MDNTRGTTMPITRGGPVPALAAPGLPGSDWPNAECSQSVTAGGINWHVQQLGQGPVLLLLHGTGASTHSWRGLLPLLGEKFTVIAPDLPGFGFTQALTEQPGLEPMTRSVGDLLQVLGVEPQVIVAHSAGAGIMLQLALNGQVDARVLIGINAALMPYGGLFAKAFKPMAKLFANVPFLADLAAARSRKPGAVERLIASTGSRLSMESLEDYRRVLGQRAHVAATLKMMAAWDHEELLEQLPELNTPLVLLAADEDKAVPPRQAEQVISRVARGQVRHLPALGHLAHEEQPELLAGLITELFSEASAGCPPS